MTRRSRSSHQTRSNYRQVTWMNELLRRVAESWYAKLTCKFTTCLLGIMVLAKIDMGTGQYLLSVNHVAIAHNIIDRGFDDDGSRISSRSRHPSGTATVFHVTMTSREILSYHELKTRRMYIWYIMDDRVLINLFLLMRLLRNGAR
jgi:hypothetical protein